jgi:hypothetical protein
MSFGNNMENKEKVSSENKDDHGMQIPEILAGYGAVLENLSIDSPVLPKWRDQWHSFSLIGRVPLSQSLNRYVLLVLFIICTLFALLTTSLRPTDITIQGMSNRIQNITLPLKEHSNRKSQTYVITGNFSYGLFSQHIVHIVPDNCIKSFQINGVPVNLHAIIRGNLCDSTNGFDINLKRYLRNGTNHFQVELIGYGRDRWFGLSLTYSNYDSQYLFLLYILLLEFGALLYLFLQNQLQLPRGCVIVILLGLLLHIIYLNYTPYNIRTYDVMQYGGHFDYIKYVATHWRLPAPNSGWETHHPPLYYISAAIIYKIATILSMDYFIALQVLSLVYFTIFLIVGVLILRMLCQNKWMLLTGTALLVFWPSGVIHAIRINNDLPYYTLSAIGVYLLLRWLADKESNYFYLATFFVALTITTKLDGLILVGLFVCVGLLLLFRKVRTIVSNAQRNNCFEIPHLFHLSHKELVKAEYMRKSLFFIIIIILACYISLFRSINVALKNHHYDLLVSNVSQVDPTLDVGNSLCNYVCFNMNIYRNQPFTDTRDDKDGRQYFFNFFLKSMLFGEYKFSFPHVQFLAEVLSFLLLQMIPFLFIGIGLSMRKITSSHAMMLLWLALSFAALIYIRYRYPFSSFQDFRYIYPAIIPFIYFYMKGIEFFTKLEFIIIRGLGYVIALLFVITSFCFFIMPLGT